MAPGHGLRSFAPHAALTTCSSAIGLYDNTSWGTPVVFVTTRFVYTNLSSLGFDNRTSSYAIGACSATFYDGATGTGSIYPGSTGAGASAAAMLSGWNDRVSSVYMN